MAVIAVMTSAKAFIFVSDFPRPQGLADVRGPAYSADGLSRCACRCDRKHSLVATQETSTILPLAIDCDESPAETLNGSQNPIYSAAECD